jgi:glycosyltransferase involved in cell wall biosynthesis
LEEPELRENLIKKGLRQAKKFNWEKTAQKVLDVFYKLK